VRPVITKTAEDPTRFRRVSRAYPAARAAFGSYLDQVCTPETTVLLPAYVGWSPREGSGVFDPVRERSLRCAFYRIDRHLNIDAEHVVDLLNNTRRAVLVLVHYFGRVDPACEIVTAAARRAGAIVIEDSAHALYTDCVLGLAGHLGDASVFSLHKMLPIQGGLLVSTPRLQGCTVTIHSEMEGFNLSAIASARQRNAAFLMERLVRLDEHLELLWPKAAVAEWVPQTLPVIVRRADRDQLYREMNERGFGVVSLYHTLIDEIDRADFSDSFWLSRRILNLPVHQDVECPALEQMIDAFADAFSALACR